MILRVDHFNRIIRETYYVCILPCDSFRNCIGSSLRQRRCPNPGRYVILGFTPFSASNTSFRRQRRSERHSSRITRKRTWHEDISEKELYEQQRQHQQQHHHHHHHQYGGEQHQQQQELQREDCKRTNVEIGCASSDQNEILIGKTCDTEEISKHQICL